MATAGACTTRPGAYTAGSTGGGGSRAGCSSVAGIVTRSCSRVVSPSCSSWTRRRRSPPGIARVRSAAMRTTRDSSRSGARSTRSRVGADAIDAQLHAERVDPATRGQRRHQARLDELPDGAFVLRDGTPWLVLGRQLLRWTPGGYVERLPRPAGTRTVTITPPSLAHVLRAQWDPIVPMLHPSALDGPRA